MEDDNSTITALIARLETYVASPSSLEVPLQATQHRDWLRDESERIEATSQLAEELMALQSIYTDDALQLLKVTPLHCADRRFQGEDRSLQHWLPGSSLTLSISTEFDSQDSLGPISLRLAATLPPFYPHSSKPPQFQLLSKYIGGFGVDSGLFGEVLRAFYHQTADDRLTADATSEDAEISSDWIGGGMDKGVLWRSGEVILFEGIEWVKEKVLDWWTSQELVRVQGSANNQLRPGEVVPQHAPNPATSNNAAPKEQTTAPLFTGKLFITPPIVDRKSEFVGYAAAISSPDDVPAILAQIVSDKRVARAAHPIINAWVCRAEPGSSIIHRDCDDDGETAAGGRLAHLLSILELENVLVVVTRWFGGVHLGPDRFKLINRAAREALDLAGLLDKTDGDPAQPSTNRNH